METRFFPLSIFLIVLTVVALAAVLVVAHKDDRQTTQRGGDALAVSQETTNNQKKEKENASFVFEYTQEEQRTQKQSVELLFVGDMMFDRYIRSVASREGNDYILEGVRDELLSVDLVVGNLEGPVTKFSSKSVGSEIGSPANYIFTFDPSWVETLYDHNIRLVTIGNNHMFNFGRDGLEQTQKYLEEGKVEYFGDLTDFETISTAVEVEGMLIGFVSYNQFSGGDEEHAVQEIRRLKTRQTVDVVIVYTHWGSEYATGSNAFQRAAAHEFIDAGADLVIGSHPHVVQEMEEYNGKRIYYSLGNFVFDQYFSQETMEGLMVRVTINPQTGEFGFQEQKVSLRNDGKTKVQDQ